MRKHLLPLLGLTLFSFEAWSQKISKVNLIVSPDIEGEIEVNMEFKKGLFNKTVDSVKTGALRKGENVFTLKKADDVKKVSLDLKFISEANLRYGLTEAAEVSGDIVPGERFKGVKTEILNEKLKIKIDCSNILKSEVKADALIIDLSQFKNLSNCAGKDLPEYSPYHVGKRAVDDGSNWFSMADDERMGREYADQFIRENHSSILPIDHPATVYLQEKMELIARMSDMPNLRPKVRVINADVLNAFALPGGYVFVFRGLMERSPSESALMGVLGHEWAHVTARHGTRGMTRTLKTLSIAVGVALTAQVWAEVTDDKVKKLVLPLIGAGTLIGAQLRILSKSRDQELEADRLGSQYALLAGYHPRGIGDMFEVFKAETGSDTTTIEKILSSHPDHETRIGRIHVLSSLFYPSNRNYVETTPDYEEVLASLGSEALPGNGQSVMLASAFINGLQKQQEDLISTYMKGTIEEMMKNRNQKKAE